MTDAHQTTPTPSGRSAARVPVLLLHGFASEPRVMRPLAAHLERAGRPTILVPVSSTRDLRAQALELVARARRLSGPARAVDVVAHSMGGLIAAYALKALDRDRTIRRIVTLATPHGGTSFARLGTLLVRGANAVLEQMQPGSAFIRELEALETPGGAELVSLVAGRDLVVPDASARIGSRTRERSEEVAAASHSDILVRRDVIRRVARILIDAPVPATAAERMAALPVGTVPEGLTLAA